MSSEAFARASFSLTVSCLSSRCCFRVRATAGEYNEPHRLVPTVGELTPSSADLEITQRMKQAGDLFGIAVLDHVIVSDTDHISLKPE